MAEVCVFGLGYVGLPTASLLANAGVRVLGVDVNEKLVESIRTGHARQGEVGLATLVKAALQSGYLEVRTAPAPSDIFVICVPTPIRAGDSVDLEAVKAVSRTIAPMLREGTLVILESTCPVGTTRTVVRPILEESGMRAGEDFDLCYCPERVLPGKTVGELLNNDRIVGGYTQPAAERARRLYERFCQGAILLTDDRTAEMVKLIENTYRDVNIAYANVLARIAEEAGVDIWKAIAMANHHPRVEIHKPGPGVGGHCIPIDPWFLAQGYPKHSALLRAAREVNDTQPDRLMDRILATGRISSGKKIAILGVAYKGDIDDARGSPALRFAALAKGAGIRVVLHDPYVEANSLDGFPVTRDLRECLQDADAAVLVTEHRAYRDLSPEDFSGPMSGQLIADARDWLDRASFTRAGFEMIVLGVGGPGGDMYTTHATKSEGIRETRTQPSS